MAQYKVCFVVEKKGNWYRGSEVVEATTTAEAQMAIAQTIEKVEFDDYRITSTTKIKTA